MNENPFHYMKKQETSTSVAETERAIQETQASMIIAKRFPRDQNAAMEKILEACSRPSLAEKAVYAYKQGDEIACDASVHLAREIARIWGNIQFGIREIDQREGESTVQSFAWDLEANAKEVREFQVKHQKKAYGKIKKITDPREIYEHVANMGARRMRACLLHVIPKDVVEIAKQKCEQTTEINDKKKLEGGESRVKAMIKAFEAIGIDKKKIQKRLGHSIKNITSDDFIDLKKIYRSIRDGETDVSHWFGDEAKSDTTDEIMNAAKEQEEKPKWPQERNGILYDSREVPWIEEGHSATKGTTQEGHWRKRRGISPERLYELEKPYLEPESKSDAKDSSTESDATEEKKGIQHGDERIDKWFMKGLSEAENEREIVEYEEVLRQVGSELDQEIKAGIEHKIAARRAEMNAAKE